MRPVDTRAAAESSVCGRVSPLVASWKYTQQIRWRLETYVLHNVFSELASLFFIIFAQWLHLLKSHPCINTCWVLLLNLCWYPACTAAWVFCFVDCHHYCKLNFDVHMWQFRFPHVKSCSKLFQWLYLNLKWSKVLVPYTIMVPSHLKHVTLTLTSAELLTKLTTFTLKCTFKNWSWQHCLKSRKQPSEHKFY